jgi:hypothetical protein
LVISFVVVVVDHMSMSSTYKLRTVSIANWMVRR